MFFNDESFDSLDWAVTLSYKPGDDSVIYAKAASGYKSGGFQDTFYLPRTNEVFFPVLDPEDLISYEVGAKSTFFGGSLRVSADLYLMDYSNKQESVLVDFGDLFCPFTFGDFDRDGFIDDFLRDGLAGSEGPFELLRFDPNTFALNATPEELAACNEPNFDRTEFGINRVELVPLNISDALTAGAEVEWFWQLTPQDRFFGFMSINFLNRIGNVDTAALPLVLTDSLACNDRVGGCPDIGAIDGNRLPFAPVLSLAINYGHGAVDPVQRRRGRNRIQPQRGRRVRSQHGSAANRLDPPKPGQRRGRRTGDRRHRLPRDLGRSRLHHTRR